MSSSGSFSTEIGRLAPNAVRLMSVALFAQTMKQPGFLAQLSGPCPTPEKTYAKMRLQGAAEMPFVRVTDLRQKKGGSITADLVNALTGKPIMGDKDAEGTGEAIIFSTQEIYIDQTTKIVDAGGRMTAQRTPYQMRQIGRSQVAGYFGRLLDQLALFHSAGARGTLTHDELIVPLATDPDFDSICVNKILAPTRGRHLVVNGGQLKTGGENIGSMAPTDILTLDHLKALRAMLREPGDRLQTIQIEGEKNAQYTDTWVLFLSPRQFLALKNSLGGELRTLQAEALERKASTGQHPLFQSAPFMYEGILVKEMPYPVRHVAGNAIKYVAAADEATAVETGINVPSTVSAGYAVDRGILLGGQALAHVYGANEDSDYYFDWLEKPYNFGRAVEIGGACMGGMSKLRFTKGGKVRDHGVIAIDSVVSLN